MQGSKLLEWVKGLIGKLAPIQKLRGDAGVVAGKVGRDVSTTKVMQQTTAPGGVQMGNVSGGVHNTTNVVHQHFYPSPANDGDHITEGQREVLLMIRRLRNNEAVFLFMEREFGTRMVMDLMPGQLLRVRRYVETINKKTRKEKA